MRDNLNCLITIIENYNGALEEIIELTRLAEIGIATEKAFKELDMTDFNGIENGFSHSFMTVDELLKWANETE